MFTYKPLPVGFPEIRIFHFLFKETLKQLHCGISVHPLCVFPPRGIAVLASTVLPGCSKSHCISSPQGLARRLAIMTMLMMLMMRALDPQARGPLQSAHCRHSKLLVLLLLAVLD